MIARSLLLAAGSALVLSACAAGPDYRAPKPPASTAALFASAEPRLATPEPTRADWWRLYDAAPIDRLVQAALTNNTDLRTAAANLAEARAALRGVRSDLLPQPGLSAGADYGRARSSATTPRPQADWTYTAGLDVSYEVDLFGRIRRGIEAASADVAAQAAAQDAVRVTVAAETTRAYLEACGYAEQAGVARRSLELLQQSYDITARRRDLGGLSDYEVSQASALLAQAQAVIPSLEGQRRSSLYQLAVLTGRPPAEISQEAADCTALPRLSAPIPVGDGATLLSRRPDVRGAERSLAANVAAIGVATADLYPSISLGGDISGSSGSTRTMFDRSGVSFGLGPLIRWTFPNTTAARARIAGAQARSQAALAGFDGAVLRALNEVEQALTLYAAELDRNAALTTARDQSAEALRFADIRFRGGSTSFLNLIDAQRVLVQADRDLAASSFALAENQISLFKALGGGWEQAPPVAVVAATGTN